MRTCEKCHGPLDLTNRRGRPRKFCDSCKPSRPRVVEKPTATILDTTPIGCVADATRAELLAAGTLDSALGQSALLLAEQMDSREVLGAGLASLAKQHAALMMACAPKQREEVDPLQAILGRDELAQRRDRLSG